ncbi:MAG: four helix bundle protein [Verrucomicrobia bacterium]|jgi:four helix bundle protein|nr:four helix bundle protein [Verrucomicrobiota bacterium]
MRDHKKLRAFELADEVVILVYELTRDFPKEEIYGLTAQARRAAVSVSSNIVEGCARESQMEYFRFLEIAYGSLRELDYQISLAVKLGYTNPQISEPCLSKIGETLKVLGALVLSMRTRRQPKD